jgi:hypothetical protein
MEGSVERMPLCWRYGTMRCLVGQDRDPHADWDGDDRCAKQIYPTAHAPMTDSCNLLLSCLKFDVSELIDYYKKKIVVLGVAPWKWRKVNGYGSPGHSDHTRRNSSADPPL